MIEQSDDRWEFYEDKMSQWQWRKFVANKVVAVSAYSYFTRQACVVDARTRGFVGSPTQGVKKSQSHAVKG